MDVAANVLDPPQLQSAVSGLYPRRCTSNSLNASIAFLAHKLNVERNRGAIPDTFCGQVRHPVFRKIRLLLNIESIIHHKLKTRACLILHELAKRRQ
nr:hypothetical protein HIGPJJAF_00085 [Gallid alphaherpesvirus 2]WOL21380.1 hypothetical protein IICANGFA_00095 [Gallid alphaherpesvirus 2]WOL21477.1 hypothetical protein MOAAAGMB_00085 [Gallid alphaherpesvirus 2]WOL21906.1 hypothetical protein JGFBKGGF_00103 [Gallid alphaherpesvirus 2]